MITKQELKQIVRGNRSKIILYCVLFAVFFSGGIFAGWFLWGNQAPYITVDPGPEEKPVITAPEPGAFACGPTIRMEGKYDNKKTLRITAWNECMKVGRNFDITCKPKTYHHIMVAGYSPLYNIDLKKFNHAVEGMYFYSWGRVALGGGAMAVFDNSRLYDIGPKIGVQARF